MPSGLVFVLIFVVAGTLGYLAYRQRQRRIAALSSYALSRGWQFSASDPMGLEDRWHGAPFGRGHSRRVQNVLSGENAGSRFLAFDYRFTEGSGKESHTYQYGCLAVALPGPLPYLELAPESLFDRIGHVFGGEDIDLESEDFNRGFRVRAASPKFASDVLTPRTMELLLRSERVSWRIEGYDLLCWQLRYAGIPELLGRLALLSGVLSGIPTFVWKDLGVSAPGDYRETA